MNNVLQYMSQKIRRNSNIKLKNRNIAGSFKTVQLHERQSISFHQQKIFRHDTCQHNRIMKGRPFSAFVVNHITVTDWPYYMNSDHLSSHVWISALLHCLQTGILANLHGLLHRFYIVHYQISCPCTRQHHTIEHMDDTWPFTNSNGRLHSLHEAEINACNWLKTSAMAQVTWLVKWNKIDKCTQQRLTFQDL